MSELYKAIAGSPITYLAADISANQTTISIADDSALPDAPNICTIGYGENIETIRYGAKSNGVLQNVTRGIEGTPRAWPAGTEVARFFTAYDYNALIENFNSHLVEKASKHIKESGSNANGSYIKFDDGTQICYMDKDYTGVAINTEYGALFRSNENLQVSYPASFTSTPTLSLQSKIYTAQFVYINGVSSTFFTFRPVRVTSSDSVDFSISAIAIGRWK